MLEGLKAKNVIPEGTNITCKIDSLSSALCVSEICSINRSTSKRVLISGLFAECVACCWTVWCCRVALYRAISMPRVLRKAPGWLDTITVNVCFATLKAYNLIRRITILSLTKQCWVLPLRLILIKRLKPSESQDAAAKVKIPVQEGQ